MQGHVVGNLLIVSLWELMGDHVRGARLGRPAARRPRTGAPDGDRRRWTSRPGCAGRDPDDPTASRSYAARSRSPPPTATSSPSPSCPEDPEACAEAVDAILAAEWVVLGPGSWFCSVIPHLMVPGPASRLAETRPAGRGAQPRGAGGGDDRLRPGRPPRRALRARTRTCTVHAVLVDASAIAATRPGWRRTWPTAEPVSWSPTSPSRGSRATTPTGSRKRSGRSWTRPESRLRGWLDRSRRGSLTYVAGFAPWL